MKVKVSVRSMIQPLCADGQTPDGERESYTTEAVGDLSPTVAGTRLFYEENNENGKTETEILTSSDGRGLTLTRTGAVMSRIRLFPGEWDESVYEIPPFRFPMRVFLLSMQSTLREDGGELRLSYRMTVGGQEQKVSMLLSAHAETDS